MGKTIDRHEMIADYLDEMRDRHRRRCARSRCTAPSTRSWRRSSELAPQRCRAATRRAQARSSARRGATRRARAGSRRCSSTSPPRRRSRWRAAACRSTAASATCSEYGAEKLLRDALVMPIYEGTSQIQSLMAMKDTLGGDHQARRRRSCARVGAGALARAVGARPLERRVARARRRCRSRRSSTSSPAPRPTSCASLRGRAADRVAAALCARTGTRSATSPSPCCTPSG